MNWNGNAKALSNLQKHGVSFDAARGVFSDAFAIEFPDDRQDRAEARFNIIGMVEHRLLFVAYVTRNNRLRIISARAAEPRERRRYHEDNQT